MNLFISIKKLAALYSKNQLLLIVLSICLFSSLFFACEKKEPEKTDPDNVPTATAPIVGLTAVQDSMDHASFSSHIAHDGGAPITERGFCWGLNRSPNLTGLHVKLAEGQPFAAKVKSLDLASTYYIRSFATNKYGTAYGPESTLHTAVRNNEIKLNRVTLIDPDHATADVTMIRNSHDQVLEIGICWNIGSLPTIDNMKQSRGPYTGNFSMPIDNLLPGLTYYVRAYIKTANQTTYSPALTFTTPEALPVLSTSDVKPILSKSAVSGGTIVTPNGQITERGICWNQTSPPTIGDFKTTHGPGSAAFSDQMTKLAPGSLYYVRAYATNKAGTAYGPIKTFRTTPTVTDADGNVYQTVVIGTQTWMVENLKTTKFNNGDPIPKLADPFVDFSKFTFPLFYTVYNGEEKNADIYGLLYTWNVAKDARQIAPVGWRIPNDDDYSKLFGTVGPGGALKEAGTTLWHNLNVGDLQGNPATNPYGFSARPGGRRTSTMFDGLNLWGCWWSASGYYPIAWHLMLAQGPTGQMYGGYMSAYQALSVRCIKE